MPFEVKGYKHVLSGHKKTHPLSGWVILRVNTSDLV